MEEESREKKKQKVLTYWVRCAAQKSFSDLKELEEVLTLSLEIKGEALDRSVKSLRQLLRQEPLLSLDLSDLIESIQVSPEDRILLQSKLPSFFHPEEGGGEISLFQKNQVAICLGRGSLEKWQEGLYMKKEAPISSRGLKGWVDGQLAWLDEETIDALFEKLRAAQLSSESLAALLDWFGLYRGTVHGGVWSKKTVNLALLRLSDVAVLLQKAPKNLGLFPILKSIQEVLLQNLPKPASDEELWEICRLYLKLKARFNKTQRFISECLEGLSQWIQEVSRPRIDFKKESIENNLKRALICYRTLETLPRGITKRELVSYLATPFSPEYFFEVWEDVSHQLPQEGREDPLVDLSDLPDLKIAGLNQKWIQFLWKRGWRKNLLLEDELDQKVLNQKSIRSIPSLVVQPKTSSIHMDLSQTKIKRLKFSGTQMETLSGVPRSVTILLPCQLQKLSLSLPLEEKAFPFYFGGQQGWPKHGVWLKGGRIDLKGVEIQSPPHLQIPTWIEIHPEDE